MATITLPTHGSDRELTFVWHIISQLAYWREQLHDLLPVMKLGIPRRKRPIDGFRTARREVVLPARLSEAAKRFGREQGSTLFMTLVAAFKTLLHRYVGEDDLRVATCRQPQPPGHRAPHRPARQYGDSPHQSEWRSQSS